LTVQTDNFLSCESNRQTKISTKSYTLG